MIVVCLLLYLDFAGIKAQNSSQTIVRPTDSIPFFKKSGIALSEAIGLNLAVWATDRYILNSDFSHISRKTIHHNIQTGFVWDSDLFGTNFILHPYHGSLYFNAARSNGFNFYQSIPFSFIGSLTWEYLFENEPPSINDILSTTIGGTAIGEVTYRLSNKVFDNSASGAKRVFREIAGTIISPIGGLNRLISGRAWKRSNVSLRDQTPTDLNISAGIHFLKPRMISEHHLYTQIGLDLEYNPAMEEVEKPYDWFELNVRMNFNPNSLYINRIHLSGLLWNKTLRSNSKGQFDLGLYQHIDFLDSPLKEYQQTPYRIAQIAAVGLGLRYHSPLDKRFTIDGKAFLTGIGLGASLSDYYWVVDRDYSFGSGFSTKLNFSASDHTSGLRFKLNAENYQLFTWKGYERDRDLHNEELKMLDVQGDKGAANFSYIESQIGYQSRQSWNIYFVPAYIRRSTNYAYRPNVQYSTYEFCVKVGYKM